MESVKRHLTQALASINKVKSKSPRSRSSSPARASAPAPVKKERKKRTPKAPPEPPEKPTPIHVCREKKTGLYKKCNTPKK